ncbi:hypothetical protein AV530_011471 [Patagioenas fasciata monilis]|uniref:Uncharacterized protein n=1 Tax=Patagioenas fasciata monilis TaxID=372326 RepID=A0A1V4KA40_PATFA|nr:hypothetical protein AV530_011471 [Patagioenas fasciata monilis]
MNEPSTVGFASSGVRNKPPKPNKTNRMVINWWLFLLRNETNPRKPTRGRNKVNKPSTNGSFSSGSQINH